MRKLLKIYLIFWRQEIQKQLMFRPIMGIFSYLAHISYITTTYVFLLVVSANLSSKTQLQLLLFLSFFHCVKGLFWIYSSQSSGFLAGSAFREGKIDFFLTRPGPTQWSVSSFRPNVFAITDFLVGIGSFLYFLDRLGLFDPYHLQVFAISLFFGAILLYSLWFSYLTFFVPSGEASAAHGLMNLFWIFGQYPNQIYSGVAKFIATIIFPTIIITTLPMNILLGTVPAYYLVILIASATFMLYLSHLLFERMLRFYTSAN